MPIVVEESTADPILEDDTPGSDDTEPDSAENASGDKSVKGRDPSEPEEAPRKA